jgi:AAA family ATP:ADP antiporter
MSQQSVPTTQVSSPLAQLFKALAAVEPFEVRAVVLSMLYFFFLFASYSVVKPVRDAMGTVYGVSHLQELFTATFIASFLFAPLYSGLASRLKLSTFLPWVYGLVAVTILLLYALFVSGKYQDRWIAAGFYVWVSTFNMLIISVFWTFMADTFSRTQAKRLFGFVAAGGTIGRHRGSSDRHFPRNPHREQ